VSIVGPKADLANRDLLYGCFLSNRFIVGAESLGRQKAFRDNLYALPQLWLARQTTRTDCSEQFYTDAIRSSRLP